MAALIYLDTHVAAWLYAGRIDLLSPRAMELMNGEDELRVSPMVLLELQYLYETDRTAVPGGAVLDELRQAIDLEVCSLPFEQVTRRSLAESWTRDPFDRLIVAQAAARRAPLLTKDRSVHEHYPDAVW